ncbi:sensor histidine kinase [Umezawaea tangerina]|uniref:histidine kinase n=1 Tax=Umezawaea tangerina TaxID=84725 RepID=A0A2T0T7E9_9PSEU|nr:HAMP domain-containing sensor histidine kinase [Umezawaea tangerina]PRY41606.1 signal transduction histidine kinase [Umezawaea tangerina]
MRPLSMRARLTAFATALLAVPVLACACALAVAERADLIATATARADHFDLRGDAACPERPPAEVDPTSGDADVFVRDSRAFVCPPGQYSFRGRWSDWGEPVLSLAPWASRDRAVMSALFIESGPAFFDSHPYDETVHLGDEQDSLRVTELLLLGGAILVIALGGLVAWLLAGRVLRPLDVMRGRLTEAGQGRNLGRRIAEPWSRAEVSDLATALNSTLDRLQTAVEEQQRFVADASHELRGPIAALKAELEIALVHPDAARWPDVVARALADTERLQQLSVDLLLLSRLDVTQLDDEHVVDLSEVCREQAGARRPPRGLVISCQAPEEQVLVRGREALLARLLGNLLENAERYARHTITVRLTVEASSAVLDVRDDGPGIPDSGLDIVFERFTRLDTARARETGGAGLGLAIARGVAVVHGGTLHAIPSTGGAHFTARVPLQP